MSSDRYGDMERFFSQLDVLVWWIEHWVEAGKLQQYPWGMFAKEVVKLYQDRDITGKDDVRIVALVKALVETYELEDFFQHILPDINELFEPLVTTLFPPTRGGTKGGTRGGVILIPDSVLDELSGLSPEPEEAALGTTPPQQPQLSEKPPLADKEGKESKKSAAEDEKEEEPPAWPREPAAGEEWSHESAEAAEPEEEIPAWLEDAAPDEPAAPEESTTTPEPTRYANIVPKDEHTNEPISGQPLTPDQGVRLEVSIGPLLAESVVRRATAFPDDRLPQDAPGHWIDVVVSSSDFRLEGEKTAISDRLYLPADRHQPARTTAEADDEAAREYVAFLLRAPGEPGLAFARVNFYYENNLLQSFQLAADIGGDAPLHAQESPDYSLAASLSDLTQMTPRVLNLITNDNADGTHQIVLRGKGADTDAHVTVSYKLNAQATAKAVRQIRAVLREIAPTKAERSKKQLIDDLRKLAPVGHMLWHHVIQQILGDDLEFVSAARGGASGIIQVARPTTADYVFPWGLMYDIPLDSDAVADPRGLKLCPTIEAWDGKSPLVPEGAHHCPSLKPGEQHEKNTLCPFGFLGYRYAIEQPASTSSLVTSIPPSGLGIEMIAALTQYDIDKKILNAHIKTLKETLQEIDLREGRTKAEIHDQLADPDLHLVYFYVHGHYDEDGPSADTYLGVGDKEKLTGQDFQNWRFDWYQQSGSRVWNQIRPLIFINACHSLEIEPDALISLVDVFVGKGRAAGVIGTEARVNQVLAIDAAESFFKQFVNERKTVAEALHNIRIDFLSKGNLFGLVYTPYCSADLRLG